MLIFIKITMFTFSDLIRLQTAQHRHAMDGIWCCLTGICFCQCLSGARCIRPLVHAAVLFLFGIFFSSRKLQSAVKRGLLQPTKKHKQSCCSMEIRIKGPSLPQATLSTSIKQLAVSSPCGGRFWSWPGFSPPCRCTILRCSTGPLWG